MKVKEFAKLYRDRGFAVCVVGYGAKQRTKRGWNAASAEPGDFEAASNIGLLAGPISGNLIVIDLDSADAVRLADEHLPATGMSEGRPGKVSSHRFFVVTDGEVRSKSFKDAAGRPVLNVLAAGRQVCVSPSLWSSADGLTETRCWDGPDGLPQEPAEVEYADLMDAVEALAKAAGAVSTPTAKMADASATGKSRRPIA